jgi:hypothetical protein
MIFFGEKVYCDVVLEKGNTVMLLGKKSNTVILLQNKKYYLPKQFKFSVQTYICKKRYDCSI